MGCVFEHTTTELSERLKDVLKPVLSDPKSKLSKKLQTEAKIKIIQNKREGKISFSGAFSAILLANNIILSHLEQIKEQLCSFISQQVTFPPLGNLDVISHNLYHSPDQNVHLLPEVEHLQNEQSLNNGSSQFDNCAQNIGLTNILDKNLSSPDIPDTNSHASSSSNIIEIEPLPETFQEEQNKEAGITEQSDTCKENNENTPDKDRKDADTESKLTLSSFCHHSIKLEYIERGTDEIIPKNHKRQKNINNKSAKEISFEEKDVQLDQCSSKSNCTSRYSLRKAKPASWVKKLLNLESIDADEGETEDERQESDPGYNPDQFDNEDESWEEQDSDIEYETAYNEFEEKHEQSREYKPSHLTILSDQDEEQLPNVEKKLQQLGKSTENEKEQVSDIDNSVKEFEENCSKNQSTSNFCNNNSDEHIPVENEKKLKKTKIHEEKHDFKFIFDHANVDEFMEVVDHNELEQPVIYLKKNIGKCIRDTNDPSVAKSSCNLCTYVSSSKYQKSKDNLRTHFSRVHFERELKFECEICGKKFGTKGNLHVHSLLHMFKKCEECGKMIQRRNFSVHARRHDPAYNSYRFECDICNQKFTTKLSRKYHIEAIHNTEKRELFPCDICGKVLASKHSLSNHKSFVHGPKLKNHICDICGKGFQTVKHLKSHQQKHSEVPQYVCSICLKAFRWKVGLKIHMQTHSDKREYLCVECGKDFTQLSSLKRHQRTHTGERPFECNLCKETFNDISVLRRHKIGKHKETK